MTIRNKIFLLIVCLLFAQISYSSQIVGEIVNVNNEFKVAYTDLDGSQLLVGDIVEVFNDGNRVSYLEVKEISSAMTKLGVVENSRIYKTTEDFSQIKVGSNVIKLINEDIKSNKAVIKPRKEVELSKFADSQNIDGNAGTSKAMKGLEDLKEKYNVVSASYAELVKEKNELEKKYDAVKRELIESEISMQEIQKENKMLLSELKKTKNKMLKNSSEDEVKRLRKALNDIKNKLIKMEKKLEGNKS